MSKATNDPGPIRYMPQRTRRHRSVWPIISWTLTAVLWGLMVFLAGVAIGLYMGG